MRCNFKSLLNYFLNTISETRACAVIAQSCSDSTYLEENPDKTLKAEKSGILWVCSKFLFATICYYIKTFPKATHTAAELSLLEWEIFAKAKARRSHSLRTAQELAKLYGLCFEARNDFALQRKEGMVRVW